MDVSWIARENKKMAMLQPPPSVYATANGVHSCKDVERPVEKCGLSTRALHSGSKPDHWTHRPIMPPLYMSVTHEVLDPTNIDYLYARIDNPTRTELQTIMAALESARYCLAFSSGMGALTSISYLLEAGQHILCCDDVYGGCNSFFVNCCKRMGLKTTFVDGTKLSNWAENFEKGKTKLVWLETPTNPTLKVIDIKATVNEIKSLDSGCIVVVDNTFMTPIFQNPLELGADIVTHSCTKYMSGHSDVLMGALMTNNSEIYESLKMFQNTLGITPSSFDCYLMIRSIKTLKIRVEAQAANAMKLANFLESHPQIERVIYPGLKTHPQHQLVARQSRGFGAMISIYLKSIDGQEAFKMLKAVRLFHPAPSLGCVCSLIEMPALMTHVLVSETDRLKLGITNNLMRLSIGLEDSEDLIEDLNQALNSVYNKKLSGY